MSLAGMKYYLTKKGGWFFFLSSRGLLNWMDDDTYLKRVFKYSLGYEPDFEHPKTINEKLQWLKLNDRKEEYTKMVDKYESKRFVAKILGANHIIPTLGLWNHVDEIDFDRLPSQFVLKCTHDSGGLVICRDKAGLDFTSAKKKLEEHLKHNFFYQGREWPYKDVIPRIIAEEYLFDSEQRRGLTDYKFFCFNGIPGFLYVSKGLEHHPTAEISFYDLDGKELPFHRNDYKPYHNAQMPSNFEIMKQVAAKLAAAIDCPFVRIDLYSVNGSIYFSEITFTPCSGMIPFEPPEVDAELGKQLKLPYEPYESARKN